MRVSFFAVAAGVFFAGIPASGAEPGLDLTGGAGEWKVLASDGVKLSLAQEKDEDGAAVLRLDYDFVSGAGYAGIRCEWPEGAMPDLSGNYAFSFQVAGELPPNNLEFKITDKPGVNVWWVNRRAFKFARDWRPVSLLKRHFSFAWGPSSEPLDKLGGLEFMLSSVNGGKGSVRLRGLSFRALPPARASNEVPAVSVSGGAMALDLKHEREFGGLAITWRKREGKLSAPARAFIELADEPPGKKTVWRMAAELAGPLTDRSFVPMPDSSARALRVRTLDSRGKPGPAPEAVEVRELDFAASPNAFAKAEAAEYRKGLFPKSIRGEVQSAWTVLGVSGDEPELLFSDEGMAETRKNGPSLEPFVRLDGKLLTWADGTGVPGLEEGYLPIGVVTRKFAGVPLTLEIKALAAGKPGSASAWVRYRLTNTGDKPLNPEFIAALRPFQVLPPWQQLNMGGGTASLASLKRDKNSVTADGLTVRFLPAPNGFSAVAAAQGEIAALLDSGREPRAAGITCPLERASGAALWRLTLAPGESREIAAVWPLGANAPLPNPVRSYGEAASAFETVRRETADRWREQLGKVKLRLPQAKRAVLDTARSQLAYVHINRDGAGIQPGSRSYERSWIRDGAMTSLSLLEFGQTEEAKEFVEWYAGYQFPSGKVPCVVDRRGPDPVPENDSHGQLIFAIANVYRFTGDKDFLARNFGHIEKAVDYIKELRASRMTPEFSAPDGFRKEPGKAAVPARAFYGLMPESISHEGYSAKPMHSYWDDFFTLRGLKDAAAMAAVLKKKDKARDWSALRDDFRRTLLESIAEAMRAHGIDYIPGCAELGDFDATSTAVAITPCGELPFLPKAALDATFEKYWAYFQKRRDDASFKWVDYTPYELRLIGAMVMLGQKERAGEMLEWFMLDRLPAGFNHWAEIVHYDRAKPAWIGDMPHTWVGSDFLRSLRTMFLYEDEGAGSLHAFAGIPAGWLKYGEPIGFSDLATPYGKISGDLLLTARARTVKLSGEIRMKGLPGGIAVHDPSGLPVRSARVNGKKAEPKGETVTVRRLPATVEFLND